jgi:hypothetical protein
MLMRLTDEEWTAIVTLFSVWLWPCLPHEAGRRRMWTGAAEHRWRWGKPALSGVSRR